ncbi:MAG: fibronectin type III domain-containing protein [Oscillospiraceae bacterium]
MLDFNKRKKILRKLSDTAEKNVLLLIPCLIAAGFVKLFYFIVCNVDIALSDSDGNFLGIKRERSEKQVSRKKDDIVYVKRGFVPRMVSLVLSFAFVMMFVPTVFPSIQSFAAIPDDWSSISVAHSVFVHVDSDTSVVYDIGIPFDDFIAPKILEITDVTSTSCKIKWNKSEYVSGTAGLGLPSRFVYNEEGTKSRCDALLNSIEVWAFVTKDGTTEFKQCTTNGWKGTGPIVTKEVFKALSDKIEITGLDPDAEYRFVLNASQRWLGYSVQTRVVPAYSLDSNNYVIGYPSSTTLETTSYPTRYKDSINEDGTLGNEILYNSGSNVQKYLPGTYELGTDSVTGLATSKYNAVDKTQLAPSKQTYIPHYSNTEVLPARRLTDVKTNAVYTHDDETQSDKVELRLASVPPADTYGYLIFRSEYESDDAAARAYKLIATVDNDSAANGDLIYTDTTAKGVKPTTAYKYYICPAQWDRTSDISSISEYVNKSDYFITGHVPGASSDSNITRNEDSIYTNTAVPKNFKISQNGTSFVLSWDAVENATGYIINRTFQYGSEPTSSQQEIARITDGTVSSYTDENIAYDTVYTYYLIAVNNQNSNTDGKNSNPPAVVSKKLAMDELYAPHTIQVVPGDDFAEISWICSDSKAVGFDIQYIKTDTLEEVTRNVESNAIAQVKLNHSEVVWADIDNALSYIKENFSGEYNDIYDSLYDAAFTANAKEITQKAEDVAVSGIANKYAYTIHNLTPDVSYSFRVRSYVLTADPSDPYNVVKRPASEYEPYPEGYKATIKTPFDPPKNVKAVSSNGNITVTWDPVDTATGYEIEVRRYDSNGQLISNTTENITGTKYELNGLRAGDLYIFTVRGTKRISGVEDLKKTDASNAAYAVVGDPLAKVTDLTAVLDGEVVKVNWTAATGEFTGYYLYITNNGKTIRKDITTNSYTHTDIIFGQTYSYYVTAYRTVMLADGTVQYFEGDRSNTETVTIGGTIGFPTDLVATSGDKEIKLDWNDVTGADGYIVYATCDGKTESFNVTKSEFTHTGLTPGKTYSYYVVAYKTVNNVPVTSAPSVTVTAVVGGSVPTPVDFAVTTNETAAILSWTAVKEATGYTVFGVSDNGQKLEIDVSKNTYTHSGLTEGDTWSYYVMAYKLDNNQKIYSGKTNTITVKIGASYPPPSDLVATPGNRTVALKWTTTKGVDGYIVYVYDENTGDFQPLSIVSKGAYEHTGLKNGKKYTYMVAAYKFVNGVRVIGDYSLAVSAIPTAGNAADVDYTINIKGTAPYGISHSELISAAANHEAFDEPVDAYFSVNDESTRAVKEVLRGYANGLKSFIVYPFDITLYLENTLVEVEPNDGFNITFTVPVPDVMKDYRDYITVVHLKNDGTEIIEDTVSDNIFVQSTDLEVLPSAIVDVGGIWCVQFTTASCSPFAFVIYKDNLGDVGSGSAASGSGGYAGSFNTGVLLITAIPDILPIEKKTKFVERMKKRYRIKK